MMSFFFRSNHKHFQLHKRVRRLFLKEHEFITNQSFQSKSTKGFGIYHKFFQRNKIDHRFCCHRKNAFHCECVSVIFVQFIRQRKKQNEKNVSNQTFMCFDLHFRQCDCE